MKTLSQKIVIAIIIVLTRMHKDFVTQYSWMMQYHFEMSPKTQSFKHKLSQKLIITIFSIHNHFMILIYSSTIFHDHVVDL